MKFGVSEGMVIAAGPGDKEIFILSSPDSGAKPGQQARALNRRSHSDRPIRDFVFGAARAAHPAECRTGPLPHAASLYQRRVRRSHSRPPDSRLLSGGIPSGGSRSASSPAPRK